MKATNEDNKDGESSAINKSSEEASTGTVIQTSANAKTDDDKQLSLEVWRSVSKINNYFHHISSHNYVSCTLTELKNHHLPISLYSN